MTWHHLTAKGDSLVIRTQMPWESPWNRKLAAADGRLGPRWPGASERVLRETRDLPRAWRLLSRLCRPQAAQKPEAGLLRKVCLLGSWQLVSGIQISEGSRP